VFIAQWQAGEISFISWLGSVLSARAKAVWAWDDIRPSLTMAIKLVKVALRTTLRVLPHREKGTRNSPSLVTPRKEELVISRGDRKRVPK
jgi:hypothetical protein